MTGITIISIVIATVLVLGFVSVFLILITISEKKQKRELTDEEKRKQEIIYRNDQFIRNL